MQKDGEWTAISARDAVEPSIMNNCSKRFNLTLPTPMMSAYAVEKIGYLAEKDGAKEILNGTYVNNPKLDNFTNTFLAYVSAHPSSPTFDGGVT